MKNAYVSNCEYKTTQEYNINSVNAFSPFATDYNQSNMTHRGNSKDTIQQTPLQAFYAGQTIFITGGTGFLGKILIEKLLRSCPDISKIYVLVRAKKNKSPATRLDEMFESPMFNLVKEEMPNFRNKIILVVGELREVDLGFTKDDKNLLIREISIIFHLAASIRFNDDIKTATTMNVVGTRIMLDLAKRMPKLKSFIHVSTVYTNCYVKHIEERFYKYPIIPEELITLIGTSSESTVNQKLARVISQWPNSYVFTKAMAEIVVKDSSKSLPIGIFRPSVVTNAAREPLAGWVDNYYTMMGLMVPVSMGLLRFIRCYPDYKSSLVPADITINALIASAWDVFNQPQRRGDKILIYNCVSINDAPLTNNDYFSYAQLSGQIYPIKNCYWMPSLTLIRNKVIYTMCVWFGHLLPALIIDIFEKCTGAPRRVWNLYKQIHDFCKSTEYFTVNEWTFADDNIHAMWQNMSKNDQLLFNFNMKDFDWPKYFEHLMRGMRLYLLKDDFSTLEASRNKWKRLYWIHQVTKVVFMSIVVMVVWKLFANIFL